MGFDVALVSPFGRMFFRAGRALTAQAANRQRVSWRKVHLGTNLVHLNYALVSLPLLLRPLSKLPPFVYTIHGVPQPEFESEPLFKVGYALERLALKHVADRAAKVVTISNYARDLLKKIHGINALVIRNGVETDLFHPLTQRGRSMLRSRLQLSQGKRIILSVGRLHSYKDPMTFVRCIPLVVAKNREAYFVLIGDGPLKEAVLSEASRLKVQEHFRLIPNISLARLTEWFQASDVFVSTSPAEMLGMVVLEAMSSGLPVIASDLGGPKEVLGPSGILFHPRNHGDLADKISAILSDTRLAIEKGQNAREVALHELRWEEVAGQYARLYKDAIGTR
jgi:glycosyltransferase involved in cell wall biosynthesis